MQKTLSSLLRDWPGKGVVMRYDRESGSHFFIALHDDTLGRPTGGTRMKTYPSPADGLEDAMRLAEGMTYKWASLGVPYGGGKAVLAVPPDLSGETRQRLLLRYGAFLKTLNGTFATGADLGTTAEDMATVARACPYVLGVDYQSGAPTDPGPFTARGVLAGMRAAVRQTHGTGLDGRTVLIQGLGGVGAPLARSLAKEGADLLLSDVDRERAEGMIREIGGRWVEPSEVYDTPCDVYAPCAVGGTLNQETIRRLRCRVVAGSANNQLWELDDAERLEHRGILYLPDYVLNAGGALAFSLFHDGERDLATIETKVDGIGEAILAILREAVERGLSPVQVARQRVDRLLAKRRGEEVTVG